MRRRHRSTVSLVVIYSPVTGSRPKTVKSGRGVSPPKTASGAWQGEGVSPPRPTPRTGQAGVMNPHARMR